MTYEQVNEYGTRQTGIGCVRGFDLIEINS